MSEIGPELPPHLQRQRTATSATPRSEDEPGPSSPQVIGPQVPSQLVASSQPPEDDEDDEDDAYGPALPPHLAKRGAKQEPTTSRSQETRPANQRVLGPTLPGHDRNGVPFDDDDDEFGPMPLPSADAEEELDGVKEFIEREERRRKQVEEAAKPKALKRDEWMLVPPTSSDLMGALADPSKLKARQFSKSTNNARSLPNNLWTETPAERQQRIADEVSGKKRRAANPEVDPEAEAAAMKRRKHDEAIRNAIEGHNQTVRSTTLVNMHAAKAKATDKDDLPVIWDRERDMAIGGRLMDSKDRNKLIQDAASLNSRFGAGKGGSFL